MSPFDFVTAVTTTKENVFDDLTEKEYQPFIINKAISFNSQDVFFASELNKYPAVPKKLQFLFYLNALNKGKRTGRWVKKDSFPEDLELLKEVYGFSNEKATSALAVLSQEQVEQIRMLNSKGGKTR
jgi:hypothetical protein